jgi:predicted dehydrogenase
MKSIGLVGCGNWGKNILRDLIVLKCQVRVADIDAAARNRAIGLGAVAVYASSGELPDCDGYVVAVPIPDLTPVSAQLLARRKPIFAEKTLCRTMADIKELQAKGGSDYLFAMHKWHYHSGIEALRQVGASGRIGELQEIHCTRRGWVNDFHGGDVFWTLAVHDLTIVKHILGYIPEQVRTVRTIRDETGLPVSLTAIWGEKTAVLLSVNGRHYDKVSRVSIHGAKGSAGLVNAYEDHIVIRDEQGEEMLAIDTTFPLFLELQEFVAYLKGGPAPRCNLESAAEVTRSLLKLRQASGLD